MKIAVINSRNSVDAVHLDWQSALEAAAMQFESLHQTNQCAVSLPQLDDSNFPVHRANRNRVSIWAEANTGNLSPDT